MLDPDARTLFLEALRPPDGFEVEAAVATTYSLDLTAMLLAPLAFARLDGFQRPVEPGAPAAETIDPFALLKSIRSYAERTTVFCQAGRIAVPRSYQRLYAYLEDSVVQVNPPAEDGVFHPKVWALRMTGPGGEVHYRLLCLSRNLTFDASWDTALVLDGVLDQSRVRSFSQNHPLGDFLAALPGLAVSPLRDTARRSVEQFADELRRVKFEVPQDFKGYAFAPLGVAGYSGMPFAGDRCGQRLVVSPFLTDKALRDLPGEKGTLVSRLEALDELDGETLKQFEDVYVLSDAADQVEQEAASPSGDPSPWCPPPSGLHAKLYVLDGGRDAWVWSGSANATTAAAERNVEFLVGLVGTKGKVGVEACLGGDSGGASFSSLLQRYQGSGRATHTLTEEQKLEQRLRALCASMVRREWRAAAAPVEGDKFEVRLGCEPALDLPDGATVTVRPITLPEAWARSARSSDLARPLVFPPCAFDSLTAFFELSVSLSAGAVTAEDHFVVRAQLSGVPENRLARVLDSVLSDPAAVLRFLRLLLATDAFAVLDALAEGEGPGLGGRSPASRTEAPLLESMLRALAREPARLDAVAQLVADLGKVSGGLDRLPPGFLQAWEPIQQARAALQGRAP